MRLSFWRRLIERTLPRPHRRRLRSVRLWCEALEPRWQPSQLRIDTGLPDGRIATISEPSNAHSSRIEFESADDFVLMSAARILNVSFTGLLSAGATPNDVNEVVVEIYRVFPDDSDVGRTSGPPTFSTGAVPTRVNSPSDVAFASRGSASHELGFRTTILDRAFSVANSVFSAGQIAVNSGGNGTVTGEEVRFDVKLIVPFDLPADRYFLVPQVGLADAAPAGSHFLWLSAPKVAIPPSPNKPPRVDLQSWMRDDPPFAPDWLRIGTDIVGADTFNASFSLYGVQQAAAAETISPLSTIPQPSSKSVPAEIIGPAQNSKDRLVDDNLINTNTLQADSVTLKSNRIQRYAAHGHLYG